MSETPLPPTKRDHHAATVRPGAGRHRKHTRAVLEDVSKTASTAEQIVGGPLHPDVQAAAISGAPLKEVLKRATSAPTRPLPQVKPERPEDPAETERKQRVIAEIAAATWKADREKAPQGLTPRDRDLILQKALSGLTVSEIISDLNHEKSVQDQAARALAARHDNAASWRLNDKDRDFITQQIENGLAPGEIVDALEKVIADDVERHNPPKVATEQHNPKPPGYEGTHRRTEKRGGKHRMKPPKNN
jgi:hypothetical protein